MSTSQKNTKMCVTKKVSLFSLPRGPSVFDIFQFYHAGGEKNWLKLRFLRLPPSFWYFHVRHYVIENFCVSIDQTDPPPPYIPNAILLYPRNDYFSEKRDVDFKTSLFSACMIVKMSIEVPAKD